MYRNGGSNCSTACPSCRSTAWLALLLLVGLIGQEAVSSSHHRKLADAPAATHLMSSCARAQLASSPKEVTETADITVAMLADPAAAVAVATGPNGAVAGLKEGP